MAKLPMEILDKIMQLIPTDADRASLALTCKANAANYEQLKNKKIAGTNEYWLPRPKRVTDSHRLQLLVRLESWVPDNLQLCYKCNMFIDKKHPDNEGEWGGNPWEVLGLRATIGAMNVGPRCPLCVVALELEEVNGYYSFKRFKHLANSVHIAEE